MVHSALFSITIKIIKYLLIHSMVFSMSFASVIQDIQKPIRMINIVAFKNKSNAANKDQDKKDLEQGTEKENAKEKDSNRETDKEKNQLNATKENNQLNATAAKSEKSENPKTDPIWDRLRSNFKMKSIKYQVSNRKEVAQFVKAYSSQKRFYTISENAKPYIYYIAKEVEKRKLPGEIALLPILESNYLPKATSPKKAAGLWQFMPSTGRYYGLKQDASYDGRRDIQASTSAALDYLEFLHEEFDHDWMLALAAYNAGEGRVSKAIKKNKKKGKATNFWALDLPKETKNYVPQFFAIAEVVSNPNKHDLNLPHIDDKPYFVSVNPGEAIDFSKAAKLADVNVAEVKALNPGLLQQKIPSKGPQEILLPVANAEKFLHNHNLSK